MCLHLGAAETLRQCWARVRYASLSYLVTGCILSAAAVAGLLTASVVDPTGQSTVPTEVKLAEEPALKPTPPSEGSSDLPTPAPLAPPAADEPQSRKPAPVTRRPPPSPQAQVPPAPPAKPGANAVIAINDAGITPKVVSIVSGGTVTWVNNGSTVHTATRNPDAAYALDSGGLAAGQAYRLTLFDPGTYRYTSAPDCLNGNHRPTFDCSAATVNVVSGVAVPGTTPVSLQQKALPLSAVVNVTDHGFVPEKVTIKSGGTATWINQGTKVHTATAIGPVRPFDTGGLAQQQHAMATLSSPGTFGYTSAPDCLNGNKSARFHCGGPFSITVVTGT